MKLILAAAAITSLMAFSNSAKAQKSNESSFEVGSLTLNIGAGLGRGSYGGYGYYGSGYYGYGTALGVKAAVERGMWQLGPGVLSLGAEIGGSFSTARYNSYKSNIIIAAVRSAYHFGWNVPNLDTYGGVSLGPGFRSYNYTDVTSSLISTRRTWGGSIAPTPRPRPRSTVRRERFCRSAVPGGGESAISRAMCAIK